MNARKNIHKNRMPRSQEEKMGMHWVLEWIELERKWKFLKHLGPESSWKVQGILDTAVPGRPALAKAPPSMDFPMV